MGYYWPDRGTAMDLVRRKWFSAAWIFAVAAITTQMISKHYAGLGMVTMAHATGARHFAKRYADLGMDTMARVEAAESDRLKQTAFRHAHCSGLWGVVSLGLVLLAASCWAAARHFGDRGSQGLMLALLVIYSLLLLVIV